MGAGLFLKTVEGAFNQAQVSGNDFYNGENGCWL
jgi:hypothetical protein